MALRVKAKGAWKNVSFDRKGIAPQMLTGFLGIQELTDYEIIEGGHSKKSNSVMYSQTVYQTNLKTCITRKPTA